MLSCYNSHVKIFPQHRHAMLCTIKTTLIYVTWTFFNKLLIYWLQTWCFPTFLIAFSYFVFFDRQLKPKACWNLYFHLKKFQVRVTIVCLFHSWSHVSMLSPTLHGYMQCVCMGPTRRTWNQFCWRVSSAWRGYMYIFPMVCQPMEKLLAVREQIVESQVECQRPYGNPMCPL